MNFLYFFICIYKYNSHERISSKYVKLFLIYIFLSVDFFFQFQKLF